MKLTWRDELACMIAYMLPRKVLFWAFLRFGTDILKEPSITHIMTLQNDDGTPRRSMYAR